MNWIIVALIGAGAGIYFLIRKPRARWQVGSLIFGEDPEEGWVQRKVTAVEWRESQILVVTKTEYKAQWWYRINPLWHEPEQYTAGEWFPEQFLETAVRG